MSMQGPVTWQVADVAFNMQFFNVERHTKKTGEKPRILCSAASPAIAADPNTGAADSRFGCLVEALFRRRDGILGAENDGIPSQCCSSGWI